MPYHFHVHKITAKWSCIENHIGSFYFRDWLLKIFIRAVASLTVPGGQAFHFPHSFLTFWPIFLNFPYFFLFSSSFWPSGWSTCPGYATDLYPIVVFLIILVIATRIYRNQVSNQPSVLKLCAKYKIVIQYNHILTLSPQ